MLKGAHVSSNLTLSAILLDLNSWQKEGGGMKKGLMLCIAVLCLFSVFALTARAQEESSSETDWQRELASDKQAISGQKEEIMRNAQAARGDEQQLKRQIREAVAAGDTPTAESLKSQLNTMHQEHIQEKMEDRGAMKDARQDLKSDRNAAKEAGWMPPPLQGGQQGAGQMNPPGYNPPGKGQGNPPGYNPPGQSGMANPPGYNPPGKGPKNPPGYNPPGRGAGNPPGFNPPGRGPKPSARR